MTTSTNLFGEVIHTYTRAQAIADGVLVDVTETAREAGFNWPVALTRAAWEDCVAWTDRDSEIQGVHQDQDGRLWDVLWMASMAIRRLPGNDRLHYSLCRIPRDGMSSEALETTLKILASAGDQGEPVITIMLPEED